MPQPATPAEPTRDPASPDAATGIAATGIAATGIAATGITATGDAAGSKAAPARQDARTPRLGSVGVILGGAGVVLMLAAGAATLIVTGHRHEVEQASITASNISTTLAAHARETFTAADRVLTGVTERAQAGFAADPADFNRLMADRAMFETLVEAGRGVPQIDVISIADPQGGLLNLTRAYPAPRISIADRDYFRAAMRPGFTGMALGTPVHNRTTGAWTFFLARQITAPDGRPLGVVSVGLSVDFFQKFYREINIGGGNAVTLFRSDGVLLARAPARDELVGLSFAGRTMFRDELARGVTQAVLRLRDPRMTDTGANPARLLAWRALDTYPLVVATTLTEDAFLAAWRRSAIGIALGTLLMAAVIMALAVMLARILTRLRASEAGLAEHRRLLDVTLDTMEQGIVLITPDRMVPVCNRRARMLLGLPDAVSETPHSFDTLLDMQYAMDGAMDPTTGMPMIRTTSSLTQTLEYQRTRPNGTVLSVRQLPLADGGALRIFTDITRQRQAERQLQQSQKLEALGQLTAGIAHDFNNILGVIITNLELLIDPAALPATAIPNLAARARNAALTAADLVKSLLTFSRQQVLHSAPTDIARLLQRSLPLLRQALASRLTLQIECPPDLWPAQIDAAQVESALLNLALNARDAAPPGGVLRVTAANIVLPEGATPDDLMAGDYVTLAVTDEGPGMDPNVLARAFEPFFTTKTTGRGSGLGLSTVFGTVRQMNGTVTIDSHPGQGTTVQLYLPRAATAPAVAPPQPEVARPDRRRILLVEDNPGLRNTVRGLLEVLGFDVVSAADAAEAMAVWEGDQSFDLVFTDVVMPGPMNGVQLVQTLQARTPRLKALLTSGFADPAASAETIAQAGIPMIQKPYLKADLAARLHALLDAD